MGPGLWWDTEVSGPTAPSVFYLAGRSLVDSLWGAEQVQAGRVTLDKDLFGRRRGSERGRWELSARVWGQSSALPSAGHQSV